MTKKAKWIVGTLTVLIIVLLGVIFYEPIWNWLESTIVNILLYLIVFGVGWFWGRYGNKIKS